MKRLLLSVFLLLVSTGFAFAQAAKWQELRPLVQALPVVKGTIAQDIPDRVPVIITFFASWCPPCTNEFNHLNELTSSGELGNAKVIGLNVFENWGGNIDEARMAAFLEKTKPKFPTYAGNEDIRNVFGNVTRIPTVVVYSASGDEVWRFVHIKDAEKTHANKQDIIEALELAKTN